MSAVLRTTLPVCQFTESTVPLPEALVSTHCEVVASYIQRVSVDSTDAKAQDSAVGYAVSRAVGVAKTPIYRRSAFEKSMFTSTLMRFEKAGFKSRQFYADVVESKGYM